MNTMWAIVLLVGGLITLWKCAGALVTGAVGLGRSLGISNLVIGLTIVAMGTSAPEVAASIAAVFRESGGDMAIGNVYGSNIANLALVGGVCAFIRPIRIRLRVLRCEMPVMVLVALGLWPFLHNLNLSRLEGVALLAVFGCLIALTVYMARREGGSLSDSGEQVDSPKETSGKPRSIGMCVVFIAIGLVGLAVGAKMTVAGAEYIGMKVGLSGSVIGLTIIAIGTSLPELMTCVAAALKGHDDISIGNLVGSNIFNTLLVVGAAGTIRPFGLAARLIGVDYWIMIGISCIFVAMAIIGRRISRIDAGILICAYAAYMVYVLGFTAGV